MPVRSRGSLLAGMAAVGLITAGIGCQSRPIAEHDSFSINNSDGSQPVSRLFSRRDNGPMMGAPQSQTVSGFTATPQASQGPAPVALQPIPVAQTSANPSNVIASSWQPVQRVNAEQPATGPELSGAVPLAMPPNGVRLTPVRTDVVTTQNENVVLPSPRLQPTPSVVYSGEMPSHPGMAPSAPREFEKQSLPPYRVEPPDVLLIQASQRVTLLLQNIEGQHLIGPDGRVNLGIYGTLYVSGMTIEEVADAVAARLLELLPGLAKHQETYEKDQPKGDAKDQAKAEAMPKLTPMQTIAEIKRELQVDVLSYNSKYYYVITDGGGYGQQIYPILITGNETVLDALAKVNGLPAVASKKKIWLARATRPGQAPKIMPVDWCGVAQRASSDTNYQIFPGDRIYVDSDKWIKGDTWLAKRLSPVLRAFGVTLLGSSTVGSIKNGGNFGGLGNGTSGFGR